LRNVQPRQQRAKTDATDSNSSSSISWIVRSARFCGSRHSDKEKFRRDLNRPKSCEMSERLLKTLRNFGAFQAEYEGSIPFTRSKIFLSTQ
jgi:hypothetical protein